MSPGASPVQRHMLWRPKDTGREIPLGAEVRGRGATCCHPERRAVPGDRMGARPCSLAASPVCAASRTEFFASAPALSPVLS